MTFHLVESGLAYTHDDWRTLCCKRLVYVALPDDDMLVHDWQDAPERDQCRNIHVLAEPRQLSYPGGKNGMWIVSCSCGYQTQPNVPAHRAVKDAEVHRAAKLANLKS